MTSLPTTTVHQHRRAMEKELYRRYPSLMFEEALKCHIYDKQEEILEVVRDHDRVSILGCNGSGKDFTTGRILHWWENSYEESIGLVIGPTNRQVNDIVWRECRAAYNRSGGYIGGRMLPRASRWEDTDYHYALGFATDDEFNIQGYHSPNLLVIITEAHAMPEAHFEAIERLNPRKIVMTGNAFSSFGTFRGSFFENRHLWTTVHISAYDTPNIQRQNEVIPGLVTQTQVDRLIETWGEDSPLFRASVLAEFSEDLDDTLVSLSDATQAVNQTLNTDGPTVLGVDVARYGTDASVIYSRRGPVARKVHRSTRRSTMELVGAVKTLCEDDPTIEVVVIDDTGIGSGVTDRLKEVQLPDRVRIIAHIAGGAARNKRRFFNRAAECWWGMREAFQSGNMDIENDLMLLGQITTRKYHIQSDRTVRLESKDEIRERGGRSPDEGDALAMTFDPRVFQAKRTERIDLWGQPIRQDNPLGLDLTDPKYIDTDMLR